MPLAGIFRRDFSSYLESIYQKTVTRRLPAVFSRLIFKSLRTRKKTRETPSIKRDYWLPLHMF
jgi:hypothetical protein